MKTYLPKVDEIQRRWYIVDAEGLILGRLAVRIAEVLRGRHKPTYTPHLDTGDFIVVINADKVQMTGRKNEDKKYLSYSGWMGGQKECTAAQLRERHPEQLIEKAVWGMMPHGKLGRAQFRKLKVYAGPEHRHTAQNPEPLEI